MLIDWFTVGAQALNFLILVWLMKRFLYKPILSAIAQREAGIADQIKKAAAAQAEGERLRDDFSKKTTEFDAQHSDLINKANAEAEAVKTRLCEEANKAADSIRQKRQEMLLQEDQVLHDAILVKTQQEVLSISRKLLTDLSSARLEDQFCHVFVQRLHELEGTSKEALATALRSTTEPALLCSAFELSTQDRDNIKDALNRFFSLSVNLRYEIQPNLIGGIELSVNGQKLCWSIAEYLTSLQAGVDEILSHKGTP